MQIIDSKRRKLQFQTDAMDNKAFRYILRDWVAPRVDVSEIPPSGEESRALNHSAASAFKPRTLQ